MQRHFAFIGTRNDQLAFSFSYFQWEPIIAICKYILRSSYFRQALTWWSAASNHRYEHLCTMETMAINVCLTTILLRNYAIGNCWSNHRYEQQSPALVNYFPSFASTYSLLSISPSVNSVFPVNPFKPSKALCRHHFQTTGMGNRLFELFNVWREFKKEKKEPDISVFFHCWSIYIVSVDIEFVFDMSLSLSLNTSSCLLNGAGIQADTHRTKTNTSRPLKLKQLMPLKENINPFLKKEKSCHTRMKSTGQTLIGSSRRAIGVCHHNDADSVECLFMINSPCCLCNTRTLFGFDWMSYSSAPEFPAFIQRYY